MLTEIVTGLSAANSATKLVRELRDIDRSIDDATYKLKLAELTDALADTKIALAEAKLALADKDEEIKSLEAKVAANTQGESCPKCRIGQMDTISTKKHSSMMLSRHGVQIWTQKCNSPECSHEDEIIHDPNNIMTRS